MNDNMMQQKPQRLTFSMAISSKGYQDVINRTIKDPQRAQRFIAAITSAVAVNPQLQACEPATILSGALLGESLGLSPSPQLGQYYLVPYKNNKTGTSQAQFQLGYKGYVQLALRSGYYKALNVFAVKRGELKKWNPITEELEIDLIEDDTTREITETQGYVATFTYLNGFTKTLYWSREKMEAHARRYSKAYARKTGETFWEKDFDAMAFKTMLRQLISKWGIMSVDMQQAFEEDLVEQDLDGLTMAEPAPELMTGSEIQEIPEEQAEEPAPVKKPAAKRQAKKADPEPEEAIGLDDL